MSFKVPQNLDISDTIFLGLSFTQILYLGGGIGLCVFLLFFVGVIPMVIIGVPVLVFAALLAFFKFNGQSFIVVLQAMINFFMSKKMYVWKQEESEEESQEHKVMRETEKTNGAGKNDGDNIKRIAGNLMFHNEDVDEENEPEVYI